MLGKLTMGGTIVFIYEWYGQKKKSNKKCLVDQTFNSICHYKA